MTPTHGRLYVPLHNVTFSAAYRERLHVTGSKGAAMIFRTFEIAFAANRALLALASSFTARVLRR